MVRVLHAADLHLDSAFAGLSRQQAAERRSQSRQTVERLVDWANDHGAELMLLAGDLFDSAALYAQTAEELAGALGRFSGAVVIAPGNHDCYTPASPWGTCVWPENVHIFTAAAPGFFDLPAYGCRVHGAAFTAPEEPREGALLELSISPELVNIGVFHGDVGARESRYRPISLGEIRQSGLDYLALGHVHGCSGLQRAGATAWAYPGCLEGRGFDETGDKGFLFGTVDRGRAEMAFVPFAPRRYEVLSADVTDQDPLTAVTDVLPLDTRGDIYRILLTGEADRAPDTDALCRALQERFFALELRDKTTLRQDIWARQDDDSLRGLFLREMRRRYEAAADEDARQQVVMAVRFGLNAMDDREM